MLNCSVGRATFRGFFGRGQRWGTVEWDVAFQERLLEIPHSQISKLDFPAIWSFFCLYFSSSLHTRFLWFGDPISRWTHVIVHKIELPALESLLEQLTIEEKVSLLSGADGWQTEEIPRLGIGSLKVSYHLLPLNPSRSR